MTTTESVPPPAERTGGWTGALRRRGVAAMPPEKLLPDSQPAYVTSWIYVFGVLTLSALLVVLISGGILALKGPAWWHLSDAGKYVNSLHLWGVELFMAFMVIHLWGKFFMAAWRGRRALTWITGAVAFLASVGTAFTGYLTQQNFDAQWISTQAKDGLNSVGIGAFFNVMDFGQMLMWHIVLLPLAVGVIVVLHILLVRKRGVVPPIDPKARRRDPVPESSSFGTRHYDIVKEFTAAFVVVALLTGGLAGVFSSPDEKSITVAQWARSAPNDFAATALTELDGSSGTATYGPPYNNASPGQKLGPIGLQKFAGVHLPIDSAKAFVLGPLQNSPETPALSSALAQYKSASADQQATWTSAYEKALGDAPDGDPAKVAPGDYGPVPTLITDLTQRAKTGSLDGALLAEGGFYQTDYSLPLLFVADGTYMEDKATAQHLGGDQWGMMNETGNYPGQAWLWLYTFWYQVKPFSTSGNADALVWGLMMLLTLLFIFVPFLPGVRSIPRLVPVHRLIWRDYYRSQRQ